jgi:hypothetical protein
LNHSLARYGRDCFEAFQIVSRQGSQNLHTSMSVSPATTIGKGTEPGLATP